MVETQTATTTCCASAQTTRVLVNSHNTLQFYPDRCIHCGMCIAVCPHAVFGEEADQVVLLQPADCIECGACQLNCPARAVQVNSGVACAAAMISAALRGSSEVTCGCDSDTCC